MVPTILQSFSFTLYKSYTCPLILTFCASPSSFHLRADCSLCNTTVEPLTIKIQCYIVLIYSTCNQIKTSSCSSSYSRYYELVYVSVCVLVVFSGRALTVVLQKIIITNTFYDLILQWNLCGDLKANFSIGFILFLCNTTFKFYTAGGSRICCCLIYINIDCHTRSFECNILVEL